MDHKITPLGTEIKIGNDFNLKNTFDCGQCFRWNENSDGSFSGIVQGKYTKIYRKDNTIILENTTSEDFNRLWKDYFDLDNDYNRIRSELATICPALQCAIDSIDGIRILRQDPWETLCSFIISQNNNIPRIKGIISRFCEHFGKPNQNVFSFPSPDTVAVLNVDDLAPLRAGFRARYIIDAAQKIASGTVELHKMYDAPISECRKELMTITGVGAKVAECTLLYGLHRLDAFPIDIWMQKAMSTLFKEVDIASLGPHAGIAQQYMFHYSRLHPEMVR